MAKEASMKDAVRQIVGRRISAVVVAQKERGQPSDQVFLVFEDGNYYEFYGSFTSTGGVDPGGVEKVISYIHKLKAQVRHVYVAESTDYFKKVEEALKERAGKTLN